MMQNTTSKSKTGEPGRQEPGGLRFRLQETVRRVGRGLRRRRTPKPLVVVPYTKLLSPPTDTPDSQPPTRSSASYSIGRGTLLLGPSTCSTSPLVLETRPRFLPCDDMDDSDPSTTSKVQTWPKMNKDLPGHHGSGAKSSPSIRSSPSSGSTEFVQVWEEKLLPELVRILDNNVKGEYHINVRRGSAHGDRIIDVMSRGNGAENVSSLLESARDKMLENLGTETVFEFSGGELERSRNERQNSQASAQSDGSSDPPQNPWFYQAPVMGDSAGSDSHGCSGSATLGPAVLIDGKTYRLVNWHLFDDRDDNGAGEYYGWSEKKPAGDLQVVHPSPDDFRVASGQQRKIPSRERFMRVGKVVAFSGPMNSTHRRPRSMRNLPGTNATTRTVTDWALCETNQTEPPNRIRDVGMVMGEVADSAPLDYTITKTADPIPGGNMIIAAGRSSGCTYGQICEVPGFYCLGDGTKTRNWAVESVGIGIAGDSGAPIIDEETHELLGQVWGRNAYDGNPMQPRIAYFTAMSDIFDDIEERWPGPGRCLRPMLPGGDAATGDSIGDSNTARQDSLGAVCNLLAEQVSVAKRSGARATIIASSCASAVIGHAKTWPLLNQTAQV